MDDDAKQQALGFEELSQKTRERRPEPFHFAAGAFQKA
jgi:hypothetical protein